MASHFLGQVTLEAVRWLGGAYECRVRLADGMPDEAILSVEEAAALAGQVIAAPTLIQLASHTAPPSAPAKSRRVFFLLPLQSPVALKC